VGAETVADAQQEAAVKETLKYAVFFTLLWGAACLFGWFVAWIGSTP
jgi:hypothetical protein